MGADILVVMAADIQVVVVHGAAVEEAEMVERQEQVVEEVMVAVVEEVVAVVEEVVAVTEDNNLLLPLYVILIP
jgi:hypothetical protein